jgi:hypothetical protein
MADETGRPMLYFPVLYALAFVFNFCWESWHGLLFAAHMPLPAVTYVPMMVQMGLVDALAILGMQLFTALVFRKLVWKQEPGTLAVFSLCGMLPAWAVEFVAVDVLHAWAYTPAMPILFGVGLTPLLQLPLTGSAGVLIARAVAGYTR